MSRLSCAAILLLASVAPLKSNPVACDPSGRYKPVEVRTSGMIDGDTLTTDLPINVFDNTKFLRVRVFGIDTPESRKPTAKCDDEVKAGLAAKEFARSIVKRGDLVTVKYCSPDKYGGRVVGRVILADGRDFGDTMIAAGHARAYGLDGSLKKSNWCNSDQKKKD